MCAPIVGVLKAITWVETGAVSSRNGSVVCDGVALASGLLTPAGLAFDGEALFFTIGGGESVASVGLTGGGVRIVRGEGIAGGGTHASIFA